VILLAGLQGSGKTTAAAKLAPAPAQGRQAGLRWVAADPTASLPRIEQLEQLGRQIQVPVYSAERSDPRQGHAAKGIASAEGDVVIVDTAGRLHVDESA